MSSYLLHRMWYSVFIYLLSQWLCLVNGKGLLILYRPHDITNECAFSQYLRYDLTFGGGLSDTKTLVFRTLNEFDYECVVEISVDEEEAYIIIVIRFPNTIEVNCEQNYDSFAVLKKEKCIRICDALGARDINTPFFMTYARGRFRFRFANNSSINADMNALLYQVTATSARRIPDNMPCNMRNESLCEINQDRYCYTSGVVCDGIKNCGVPDWFDERLDECELPEETLGLGPILAVLLVLVCALMAASHVLVRCLPPVASSFFIFNANEDNRLCIESVFTNADQTSFELEKGRNNSLIPISLSSSEDLEVGKEGTSKVNDAMQGQAPRSETTEDARKGTIKLMTTKLQQTLRAVMKQKDRNSGSPGGMDPSLRSLTTSHLNIRGEDFEVKK